MAVVRGGLGVFRRQRQCRGLLILPERAPGAPPDVVVLFPGQGAQRVGMGAAAAASCPRARALFDEASELLGYDLLDLCSRGPPERLDSTEFAQPALLVSGLAGAAALEDAGALPRERVAAAAGLSLGEFAALVYARALPFGGAVTAVAARGAAMAAASAARPSGMAALLNVPPDRVSGLLAEAARAAGHGAQLWPANYLCAGNLAVSGDVGALEALPAAIARAGMRGARATRLAVSGGFHCEYMAPAAGALADALSRVPVAAPDFPVACNVTGAAHDAVAAAADGGRLLRSLLVRQVSTPVAWSACVDACGRSGGRVFVEVSESAGVRGALTAVARRATKDAPWASGSGGVAFIEA